MYILVATPLQILLFDFSSGRTNLLRAGDGQYYGISWNSDSLVTAHSGVDPEKLKTWADYRNAVRGYVQIINSEHNVLYSAEELSAPHQIECVEDKVISTNTGKNSLSVFDFDGNLVRNIYLNDIHWDKTKDGKTGNHFNSVHKKDDRLWVVAHNNERPSEVWELSWPEMQPVNIMKTNTSWAHNIWLGEWGIVTCNSRYGSLYEVNSGKTIWEADEEEVISRGLSVTEDYIFVGRSEYGSRGDRKISNGGVWVIDRKTLKTLDKFIFPGSGCVNEIRIIDLPDECHNGHTLDYEKVELIKKLTPWEFISYQYRKVTSIPFRTMKKKTAQLRKAVKTVFRRF